MVLSQLSRAVESRQGDDKPRLSDLRDSGGIEQDAELVAFVYRAEVYEPERKDLKGLAELIIAKQRNGPVGFVPLVFLHSYTTFKERSERTAELMTPPKDFPAFTENPCAGYMVVGDTIQSLHPFRRKNVRGQDL